MSKKFCLSMKYAPSEDVVARDVQGEFIIIPITSGIGDLEDEIFTLNDTGRAIWDKLDGKRSLKEVASALSDEFDSSSEEIEKDVLGITEELLKRRMLVENKRG
ncbi:MAG: PqqD family protein [Candidatus Omnitrophica bacterium]|nr:PqqD family protein [Candidatus Omnitrophota bacterium]